MNLDDYINNESVGTPAGLNLTPPPDGARLADDMFAHTTALAIPIKSRKEPVNQPMVPQSVPVPAHHQRAAREFSYIDRNHRKTSIDETMNGVSCILLLSAIVCHSYPKPWVHWARRLVPPVASPSCVEDLTLHMPSRTASAQPTFHPTSRQSIVHSLRMSLMQTPSSTNTRSTSPIRPV